MSGPPDPTDGADRDIGGHLQAAARELIAAARAALDSLEDVVSDPSRLLKRDRRPAPGPKPVERIEVEVERSPGAKPEA